MLIMYMCILLAFSAFLFTMASVSMCDIGGESSSYSWNDGWRETTLCSHLLKMGVWDIVNDSHKVKMTELAPD